jgi:hypothetical protein
VPATARAVVLFNESSDEYQAQLRDYLDHFRPHTACRLRKNASARIARTPRESLAFDALSGAGSSLALLNGYQSRLHYEYQCLLKTLLQM